MGGKKQVIIMAG